MLQAASRGFLDATDMADYLVARGLAFREAHHLVGEAVSFALANKKELYQLSLEQLQSFSALIREDIFSFLETAPNGGAPHIFRRNRRQKCPPGNRRGRKKTGA